MPASIIEQDLEARRSFKKRARRRRRSCHLGYVMMSSCNVESGSPGVCLNVMMSPWNIQSWSRGEDGQTRTSARLSLAAGNKSEMSQYLRLLRPGQRPGNSQWEARNVATGQWEGLPVVAVYSIHNSEESHCHNNSSPWHPQPPQSDLGDALTSATTSVNMSTSSQLGTSLPASLKIKLICSWFIFRTLAQSKEGQIQYFDQFYFKGTR